MEPVHLPDDRMALEPVQIQRREDFRAGALGLLIGLPILAYSVWGVRAPSVSDYVRIEVVPEVVTVVREGGRGRLEGIRLVAGGRRYQAENVYVDQSGYSAAELRAALRPGAPVSLWVENPDAETPRIRGIVSATVSAPPETGVAADNQEVRFMRILGFGFAGLGALSVVFGLRRRPPNPDG